MEKNKTIGVVVAMPEERKAIMKKARLTEKRIVDSIPLFEGIISERKICLAEGGMGTAAALKATRLIINETQPAFLISAGYCGGIRKGAKVSDIIICGKLHSLINNEISKISFDYGNFTAQQIASVLEAKELTCREGSFITAEQIISKTELSSRLPPELKTPVLEMESAAVAIAANSAGVPFLGIRSVSDDSEEELEFSIHEFTDDQLRISIPKVIFTCLKRPGIIPQLARLASNSAKAGKTLGIALETAIGVFELKRTCP